MSWFLAKSFTRSFAEKETTPQFDEQLRLVEADDETTALQKRKLLASRNRKCSSTNSRTWYNGSLLMCVSCTSYRL